MRHRARLQRGLSLLSWLAAMCTDKPADAIHAGFGPDDLRVEPEPGWLPIERGASPRPELDALLAGEYVERTGPVPTLLLLASGTLKCREAIRFTRKGREAVIEYERLRPSDPLAALEIVIRMCGIPEADAVALREDLSE